MAIKGTLESFIGLNERKDLFYDNVIFILLLVLEDFSSPAAHESVYSECKYDRVPLLVHFQHLTEGEM